MPVFKVYIIDDDPRAVKKLAKLVYRHDELLLAGTQTDPQLALEEIKRYKPDILFLDLEMTPLSGWEVMKRIDARIKVIVCTADDRAGTMAYDSDAIEYLVKPFAPARFDRAVSKATGKLEKASIPPDQESDVLYVTAGGIANIVRIDIRDIEMVEAQSNRCRIFHTYDVIVVDQSLKEVHRMLPADGFARIHKSFVIALSRYYRHANGYVHLVNVSHRECREVSIGEKYAVNFYKYVREKMKKY